MKAMLVKTEGGLVGSTPRDHEAWTKFRRRLERMRPGTWLRLEWATPRNGPHHRKLFALLRLIAENSEVYDTEQRALVAVKLAAGYFDPVIDPTTGEVQKIVHSIAYESMEQEEFDAFYRAALHGTLTCILPQFDQKTAERLLREIVSGWASEAPR